MTDALRIRFDVTTAEVSGRKLRAFSREGFSAVGVQWDSEYKMRHFLQGAEQEYGYAPRTPGYLRRRRRGVVRGPRGGRYRVPGGGALPLVYSGKTRSAVRQRMFPRAFPTRVTISLPTPSYIRMRPKPKSAGGNRTAPNPGEELTRVTDQEYGDLEATYQRIVERRISEELN